MKEELMKLSIGDLIKILTENIKENKNEIPHINSSKDASNIFSFSKD